MPRRGPWPIALLLGLATLLAAAAPAGAAKPAWERSDVTVILLPGFASTYPTTDDLFAPLSDRLAERGWRTLPFSYAGADAPHGCEATEAGLDAAEGHLRALIASRKAADPEARFVLVGHSLGGLVGWWHLHTSPDEAVVGVIAVDAPLHGVDPWKLLLLSASCGADVRTLDDLAALHADRDGWRARWADLAARATARGVVVRSVGNRQDCYYWPTLCGVPAFTGWEDDRESQLVTGAEAPLDVPIDPGWGAGPLSRAIVSHRAVLAHHADAIADLATAAATPR